MNLSIIFEEYKYSLKLSVKVFSLAVNLQYSNYIHLSEQIHFFLMINYFYRFCNINKSMNV